MSPSEKALKETIDAVAEVRDALVAPEMIDPRRRFQLRATLDYALECAGQIQPLKKARRTEEATEPNRQEGI